MACSDVLIKCIDSFLKLKYAHDEKEKNGYDSYDIEFHRLREFSQSLKSDPYYSTNEGEKACNVPKNRYKDILPFDYCRVKLKESLDGGSDYINASFIKTTGRQKYIAAQGPLQKTVDDFWSMIWDYNVSVVVMACQEYEGVPPKLKCQRYWTDSSDEPLVYGKITVRLQDESMVSNTEGSIIRRKLLATKNGSTKLVTHLHYTKWPDKFIPKCVGSILKLLTEIRECHKEERVEPIVFHCSAGCGRTGTLLVLDYIWSLLKSRKITDKFSVYDIIVDMRKQRMTIVQSSEQFMFVYEAVAELFKQHKEMLLSHKYQSTTTMTGRDSVTEIYVQPAIVKYLQEVKMNAPTFPKIIQLPSPYADMRGSLGIPQNRPDKIYINSEVTTSTPNNYAVVHCNHQNSTGKNNDGPPVPDKILDNWIIEPKEFKYRGRDIGFPNRVGKPRGPREPTTA